MERGGEREVRVTDEGRARQRGEGRGGREEEREEEEAGLLEPSPS